MSDSPRLRIVSEEERYQSQVVEYLEGILAQAKAGELRSVMVVREDTEGFLSFSWSGTPSISERIGKLELLRARIINHAFEE
jgi:hypothetical protein